MSWQEHSITMVGPPQNIARLARELELVSVPLKWRPETFCRVGGKSRR